MQRLNWFNSHYIKTLPIEIITERGFALFNTADMPTIQTTIGRNYRSVSRRFNSIGEILQRLNFILTKHRKLAKT